MIYAVMHGVVACDAGDGLRRGFPFESISTACSDRLMRDVLRFLFSDK